MSEFLRDMMYSNIDPTNKLLQHDQDINDVKTDLAENTNKTSSFINARNKTSQPKRKRYFFYDSFARTSDSTTSLGNCETNNTAYTIIGSNAPVWGVQGGQAYVASTSSTGNTLAYQETYETDGILEATVNANGTSCGLGFRISDASNFWTFVATNTLFQFTKWVAGTQTIVANGLGDFTNAKLSVLMKGNKIECYIDGILKASAYDSFNNTATKHGMCSRGTGTGANYRWDNLCMKPVGEVPLNINDGFEGSSLKWYWGQESAGLPYSIAFNTAIKKTGNQSLRVELNSTDPVSNVGKHRSEIVLPSEQPLEEHWYGVSIYLPNGGVEDYAYDNEKEIIMQWHTTPDSGEENVSPPLCLSTFKGEYYVTTHWGDTRLTTQSGLPTYEQSLGSYETDKGKWVDWVFHVRWGWLADHEPITEVYKNGVLVFERNGYPNAMNDALGIYQKVGIYKWVWDEPASYNSIITKRVIYYDDFWMK